MDTLSSHGLKKDRIAGMSFDGAMSMRSDHVGVQARIKEDSPHAVYIWCFNHVLNLCICDTTESIPEVI